MNVNIQNTMAVGLTFVLVTGALVVLAAVIGSLLCRAVGRRSGLAGRFAFAGDPPSRGNASHDAITSAFGIAICRAPGIHETGFDDANS